MKLFSLVGACLFSGIVCATPVNKFVFLGDSLSDTGNLYEVMNHQLPPCPPYFEGRFSNGPIWSELLVASYFSDPKAHQENYAVGGAGIAEEPDDEGLFTLKKELDQYFADNNQQAKADAVYVIWIGANNYLGIPPDTEETLERVNTGIVKGLESLVEHGAKNIMVMNLPDLGKTPAAYEFNSADIYTYFTRQHNMRLDASVAELKTKYPDVHWWSIDMETLFNDVLDHPSDNGFTNTTGYCYNSLVPELTHNTMVKIAANIQSQKLRNACDGYIFFDLVHPTTLAHQTLARKVRSLLDEAGLEVAQ